MATVILDVPTDKIEPFYNMVIKLGIDKNSVSAFALSEDKKRKTGSGAFYKIPQRISRNSTGWEFFKNELEYE